jgi:hypothetical protein
VNNSYRVGLALAGLTALQASAIDMAAMERWSNAKVVSYRIEGKHNARSSVVYGDYEGKADVLDHITVEFKWDTRKRQPVGPVTVKEGKTELKNLKSDGTNCPPPTLQGEYEHFQSASTAAIDNEQIQIKGTRVYPPAMVSNYPGGCSMRSIPGGKENVILFTALVDPQILAMPEMAKDGPVSVSSDGKSFSVKGAENWIWTFTPSIVQ